MSGWSASSGGWAWWTRRAALAALALLAACAPPPAPLDPAGYRPLDHALPPAARLLLPRGVTEADARVQVNCYAYVSGGLLYPIRRPDGGQYCV